MNKHERHTHRAIKTSEAMNILIDKVVGKRPPYKITETTNYLKYRVKKQRED
jgi:hypothetical protein